jgi:hypothetical protein
LQVSGGDVVHEGVAQNIFLGVGAGHVFGPTTDHDRDFSFKIHLAGRFGQLNGIILDRSPRWAVLEKSGVPAEGLCRTLSHGPNS